MLERYSVMKKAELLALAAEAGVKGRSRMTRAQLIEVLSRLSEAVESAPGRVPASEIPPARTDEWPLPPAQEKTPELPSLLGRSRLVLLPQGPRTAFAYWELAGGSLSAEPVLKVVSARDGAGIALYGVSGRTGSYYIQLDLSGQEIEALLGHRAGGVFHQILRSNRIRLPDDSPSEDLPTTWMTRRRDHEEIYRLSLGGAGEGGHAWAHEEYRKGYPVFSLAGERRKDKS